MCDDIFLMCEMYVSLALVNFVDVIVLYFSVMMSSRYTLVDSIYVCIMVGRLIFVKLLRFYLC